MEKGTVCGMERIKDYDGLLNFLGTLPQFMDTTGVERGRRLLEAMGAPDKEFPVIHVAGTNGKGSTCAYLERIFRENGYKTGLFVSPHLTDIRERILINGKMVSKEGFLRGFLQIPVSGLAYFDYLLGIAMAVFREEKIDICILETGLGGRLDATNAVSDKLISVITTVSLEHTAILGGTTEQIAYEKAGIIKENVPVVSGARDPAAAKVIRAIAQEKGAEVIEVGANDCRILKNEGNTIDFSLHNGYYKKDCFTITTKAVYQVYNCAAALTAAGCLAKRGVLAHPLLPQKVKTAVKETFWQGRMEEVLADVYIDGAHNVEGIEAFLESAAMIGKDRKCSLFFSAVKDKNYEEMISRLCCLGLFDAYFITGAGGSRRLSTKQMAAAFRSFTKKPISVFDTVEEGFDAAAAWSRERSGICFCTGSLYLVGDIKNYIGAGIRRKERGNHD